MTSLRMYLYPLSATLQTRLNLAFPTRGPEHVHHPAKCTSPKSYNSLSLNNHKIVNEEDIKAALAKIEISEDLNYRDIACKFKLMYITLLRYTKDLTCSRADF
jgi:hypothetical protein